MNKRMTCGALSKCATSCLPVAVLILGLSSSARAQQEDGLQRSQRIASGSKSPLTDRERQLLERIEKLEKRLTALESKAVATPATSPISNAQSTAAPTLAASTPAAPRDQATSSSAVSESRAQPSPPVTNPSASSDPSVEPWGPAVNGIYTAPETKDLGSLTGLRLLEGVKFRGWISTYYEFNLNTPSRTVVNANQNLSVVQARNATIEGRTFDVHSNSFTLELAEIEFEKVPQVSSRLGFKFDLAFGDTQDIIADTIAASTDRNSISQFDKVFQHASIGYLAPIGKGLRIDFGKFVTHIGGETIENIKNHNFSRAFFYTYAIPFQDTGFRFHYDWSDKSYSEFYILNGWNVTFDNNKGKTFSFSQGWTPSSKYSLTANWIGGPEQNDNSRNWRHLGDFQIGIDPTPRVKTLTNVDVAWEKAPPSLNGKNATWDGVAEIVRYEVTPRFSPAFRFEWYRDPQGFTTAVRQNLLGYTLTLDYKLGNGRFDRVLVRPEWRYDHSTADFFTRDDRFRSTNHQQTVGIAFVYYF